MSLHQLHSLLLIIVGLRRSPIVWTKSFWMMYLLLFQKSNKSGKLIVYFLIQKKLKENKLAIAQEGDAYSICMHPIWKLLQDKVSILFF